MWQPAGREGKKGGVSRWGGRQELAGGVGGVGGRGEFPGQGWEVAEYTARVSMVQVGKLANAPGRAVEPAHIFHSSSGLTG